MNPEEFNDTRHRVDLENSTCEVHEGQKCVSFCLDCNVALCLTCYKVHKDHDRKALIQFYDEKIAEIQKVKRDIGENLRVVDSEESNFTKMSDDKSREYKKVKDDIDKREADIIAEVKKYSQKLHNEVDKMYQPILTGIQNNLLKFQETKVQLKEKKDIVDNILHSHQDKDVLDYSKAIGDMPVPRQFGDIPSIKCLFTPGDSLDSKVTLIFGEVNKIPELKLIKTFQTELEGVTNIINCNTNQKVISDYSTCKLQSVRFGIDTMTVIKEEDTEVYDMALMDNGDLVISAESDGKELKIYTEGGTVKPYKSFHPLYTLAVHVNKHNEVLVGLSESPSFPVKPDSIRKVVVLNQSGDIQHTYQYTRDRQRLFTWPERIITCQNMICVVDLNNALPGSLKGRVVALDINGGHVQWVYNGQGNQSNNKFYPSAMAVTPTDLILVGDDNNYIIHVLNPRGQVIVCHQLKDLGMECPLSLCMDNKGLLCVGCGAGEDKAKIHTMTIM